MHPTAEHNHLLKQISSTTVAIHQPHLTGAGLQSQRLQAKADQKAQQQPTPTSPPPKPSPVYTVTKQQRKTTSKFPQQEAILALINRIPSPQLPESRRDKITGAGEWSNLDLDEAFNALEVNCMPARFLLDLQGKPAETIALLKEKIQLGKVYLPLWIRHHWLLGVFNNNVITIADSSPGVATKEDITTLTNILAFTQEAPVKLQWFSTPRQPRGSVECGLHVVVNALLHHTNALQAQDTKPAQRVIEYERRIGPIIANWLSATIPIAQLFTALLTHIAEVGIELISAKQVLAKCDRIAELGPVEVTWVEVTDEGNILQTWVGSLTKRKSAAWVIEYQDHDGYYLIPSPNVNYLTVKSEAEDWLYEDLLAKNVTVPTNHATLVGDQISVAQLKEIYNEEQQDYSKMFLSATAPSTRRTHNNMLKLLTSMPPAYNKMDLQTAILLFIQQRATVRKWKSSTLLTKMASIQGALRLLPFYRRNAPSVTLASTIWKMAMKGASYAANTEIADQAPILTNDHMNKLISHHAKADSPDAVASLTEIAWLVAGRVGDVAQLAPEDVTWVKDGILMVRFRRGKTARRGQYSIATTTPSAATTKYIHSMAGELWLFPQLQSSNVKDYLRRHIEVAKIECRSIRRGRLQLLSEKGMKDNDLLHVSRHQTLSSLRRYLNFGTRSGENLRRARKVERALGGERNESDSSDTSSLSDSSSTLSQ